MKCWPEDPASGEILGIFIFIASNSAHIQHSKVTPRHRLCIIACSALQHCSTAQLHIQQRHTAQLPTKVNKKTAAVTTAALHAGAAWPGPDYD